MKKFHFFSVAIAVVMALFICVRAGTITKNITPTMQGMFPISSLILEAPVFCTTLTGPNNSCLTSVVVEGTFSANCIVASRKMEVLYRGVSIASNTFNDGKFSVTVPIPNSPCYPANDMYCVHFVAQRVTLTNPCAASINSGTGVVKYNYSP